MNLLSSYILTVIETGGFLAPLLFICFHLLRPLFFLPVIFICLSGGLFFGAIAGTVYSIIGITLSSVTFYAVIQWMPKTYAKLIHLKQKLIGKHSSFTISQITLLRLIPFIHFHLLSLCLIEISTSFKDYTKSSFISNVPLAFIYTAIGQWIAKLSPAYILLFFLVLIPFIYMLRRKEIIIKWKDFFQLST